MNLFHSEAGFFIFDKEENFYDLAVFYDIEWKDCL